MFYDKITQIEFELTTRCNASCPQCIRNYYGGKTWHTLPIVDLGLDWIREKFTEKTLSELYDPDHMPKSLLECHRDIDYCVETCYQEKPFKSDVERLECLFTMYEKMTNKNQLL